MAKLTGKKIFEAAREYVTKIGSAVFYDSSYQDCDGNPIKFKDAEEDLKGFCKTLAKALNKFQSEEV